MSSINPVFLLPQALAARGEALAQGFADSLTMGAGQLSGKLVRLFPEYSLPIEFAYYLVFPQSRLGDPRITSFVDWMRAELARDQQS